MMTRVTQNITPLRKKKGKKLLLLLAMCLPLVVAVGLIGIYVLQDNSVSKEVSWTQFQSLVQQGGVKKIVVMTDKNQPQAVGELSDFLAQKVFGSGYRPQKGVAAKITAAVPSSDKFDVCVDLWRQTGVFRGDVTYERGSDISSWIWSIGPAVILLSTMGVVGFLIIKTLLDN